MIGRQNSFTLMTAGQAARRARIRASPATSSPASYFSFGRFFASNPKSGENQHQSRNKGYGGNPEEGRDRELGGDNETMHQRNLQQERPDIGVTNQQDSDLAKTLEEGKRGRSEPTIDIAGVQSDQVENIRKSSPSGRGEGTTHVVFRRDEDAPSIFTKDPQTADFADENSSQGDAKMWQAVNQEESGLPNMEQGTRAIGEQEAEDFKKKADKNSDRGYGHVPPASGRA